MESVTVFDDINGQAPPLVPANCQGGEKRVSKKGCRRIAPLPGCEAGIGLATGHARLATAGAECAHTEKAHELCRAAAHTENSRVGDCALRHTMRLQT